MGLLIQSKSPVDGTCLIFDDDDRVAYAYIEKSGKCVADVWLYNVASAPETPEWEKGPEAMPFLNPKAYIDQKEFIRPLNKSDIAVRWKIEEKDVAVAGIYIHNKLHAVLRSDKSPGKSLLAKCEGPLAYPLLD
jgi:hypothetical protein